MSKYWGEDAAFDHFGERKAFCEGCSFRAWRPFGAHPVTDKFGRNGYLFRLWAPDALRVSIIGDFNNWDPAAHPMRLLENHIWEAFVFGPQPLSTYQYAVYTDPDTYISKPDPFGFCTAVPPHRSSKVYHLANYTWSDQPWLDYRAQLDPSTAPLNIYECHLGSWRRTGNGQYLTYREIASYLVPYLKELGCTHVELLPVTEHIQEESLGYSATGYFAPTSRFGLPNDFKYLVDQLHQAGIGVILDWPPSTASRLPFELGPQELRSFLFSSAMFWLEEYHVDGLHVASPSGYPEAQAFFSQLTETIRDTHPDVLLMASDPRPVKHLGFHLQWHRNWTPNTPDGQDVLALSHTAVTEEQGSLLTRLSEGAPDFAAVRLFQTAMMTRPGKKLTFMGSEFAQQDHWRREYSLDWHLLQEPEHIRALDFSRALNRFYLSQPPLWELDFSSEGYVPLDERSFLRFDRSGDALLVVCNSTRQPILACTAGVPYAGVWRQVFTTDEPSLDDPVCAGLTSIPRPCCGQPHSLTFPVPAMSCVIWQCARRALHCPTTM